MSRFNFTEKVFVPEAEGFRDAYEMETAFKASKPVGVYASQYIHPKRGVMTVLIVIMPYKQGYAFLEKTKDAEWKAEEISERLEEIIKEEEEIIKEFAEEAAETTEITLMDSDMYYPKHEIQVYAEAKYKIPYSILFEKIPHLKQIREINERETEDTGIKTWIITTREGRIKSEIDKEITKELGI